MRNFWGYTANEKYAVGCNGATIYVYNRAGEELARFEDFASAYWAVFCPGRNVIAVKSAENWLGFYDLDTLQLMKKICVGVQGNYPEHTQDESCCFSPDGTEFLNIERNAHYTFHIVVYNMDTLEEKKRYFFTEKTGLDHIEYSKAESCYLLSGHMRNDNGVFDYPFIAKLRDGALTDLRKISDESYEYLFWYKRIEMHGFTTKKIKWTPLKNHELVPVTLAQVYENFE